MPIPAAVIAGIIGAGASQSNSVADTLYTNHMNYVMANRANEANERINQSQIDFAREMWNAQNEYNDPSAEYQRLVRAGINPHLYYAKNSAGAPAQLQSAPSQIPMQAARAEKFNMPDMSGFGSLYADSELKEAQINNLQEDTRTRAIDNMFEYDKQINSLEEQRSRIENLNIDSDDKRKRIEEINEQIIDMKIARDYSRDLYSARTKEAAESAELRYEQKVAQQLNNRYQQMVNNAFPSLNAANVARLNAAVAEAYAHAGLFDNMSLTEMEKKAYTIAETALARASLRGVHIDNFNKQAFADANLDYIKSMTQKIKHSDNWVQNYAPFVNDFNFSYSLGKQPVRNFNFNK